MGPESDEFMGRQCGVIGMYSVWGQILMSTGLSICMGPNINEYGVIDMYGAKY